MANQPPQSTTAPNFWPKVQAKELQQTTFPAQEAVNFDPDAFDDLVRTQGLTFIHWRALKCPIGVVDADDERHPHGDHGSCSNGFLYKVVGPMTSIPSNNSNNPQVQDMGILNQVNLVITAPRFYDVLATNGEQQRVLLAPYDRLYLSEEGITVIQWQLFEACGGPTDKMDYPIAAVEHLVNSQGKDLVEGCDFTVENGLLKWVLPSQKGPAPNPEAGTGGILSIRYRYRPYWYVKDLPHEIRVSQLENSITGERQTERLNQQAVLQREYVFENQANDTESRVSMNQESPAPKTLSPTSQALGQSNLRQILSPRKGRFGPR